MSVAERLFRATNDLRDMKSFEFVYGYEEDFIFVEGHLGISNEALIPLGNELKRLLRTNDKSEFLRNSFLFCCLLPRDYTIHNRRKDIIGSDLSLLMEELSVISTLQEQYPKVPELWDHRRYVLRQIITLNHNSLESLRDEITHCYRMCDKYPRNYYSWTTLQVLLPIYTIEDILYEVECFTRFSALHIKDYSAFHRFQTLVLELQRRGYSPSALRSLLQEEEIRLNNAIDIYGENDSIVIHRNCLKTIGSELD